MDVYVCVNQYKITWSVLRTSLYHVHSSANKYRSHHFFSPLMRIIRSAYQNVQTQLKRFILRHPNNDGGLPNKRQKQQYHQQSNMRYVLVTVHFYTLHLLHSLTSFTVNVNERCINFVYMFSYSSGFANEKYVENTKTVNYTDSGA